MTKHRVMGGVLAAILVAAAGLVAAQPRVPHLNFTDQRLPNGLRVIIAPDHSAPVFGVAVTYNVGSRNERPGRTGFAHLFEHMMFQGSANVGKGEHMLLIENNGGGLNGSTNEDRTNYYEILPRNQLDLALFLEADRMRSLALNQANLDNQRKAVQEERRLGVDNQPYGKAYLEIDNLSYDNFAYKHSTIGSMRDLNAASLADVKDFFRIYYAPNNAVLTLVGDLDPDQALEAVKKYFGDIPSQPAPPAVDLTEPEHYGMRSETIEDPLARLPMVLMSYHIPSGNTADSYALRVLGNILGTGESSRLYLHLVKETQLATAVQLQVDARIGPGLFYVLAMPRPGVKPADVQRAVEEQIAAVAKSGVTAREMEKARAQFRRREIQSRQSDLYTAMRLGIYAVYFNDPDLINTIFDKINAVTPAEVQAAAAKYLVADQESVVTDIPAPGETKPAHGAQGGAR